MSEIALELSDIQELNDHEDYGIYKKYVSIWEQPNALDILLDVVGSEEFIYKLTSSSFKKKLVWEQIAAKIESQGILLGENPCKVAYQKWLSLKKTFISVLNKKSGKTPPWFGKLSEIFEKSEGKLLGSISFQGDEEVEQVEAKGPKSKKMKQEYLPIAEEDEVKEGNQIDPGQYIIEEVGQVTYADVIAIMQQLELERKEREEAREQREKERFDKLADLIRQQNTLTEKLITILSKQSTSVEPTENHPVLPMDSVCIIATEDIQQ
ncbi:uncharacterized protein LOC124182467 [Neodiprion fabricii]|uniref:uncharacterized protein LOC124182467 n=1 Tax=Neodiprion fabricii TaxID=2872261 RepID=UPI001ED929AB|nr:uncharacterized protein LOC124182467 [Neodiprion fabricii]